MCIFCGGQCGGAGEFLISMGLPLLALYFFRIKGFLLRLKDKILGRPPRGGNLVEHAGSCKGGGEPSAEPPPQLKPFRPEFSLGQLTELSVAAPPGHHVGKAPKQNLAGVRGWLLLLCLNLLILIPAFSLYQINCNLDFLFLPQYRILLFVWSKSYYYFSIVNIFVMLFITAYSFYSGLQLWTIKAGAIRTAKTFLIVQLSLTLVMLALLQITMLQLGGNRNMAVFIIEQLVPPVLYFSVWYAYLGKSRRVDLTYAGLQAEPRPRAEENYSRGFDQGPAGNFQKGDIRLS